MTTSSIRSGRRTRSVARRATIRMRPYKPGDEAAFVPRADFAQDRAASAWDWSAGAPGPTWTLHLWSGQVLGVGGAVRQGDRWLGWAQLAEIHPRDWPQLLWLARRVLELMRIRHGPVTIEALARPSMPAIACLRRLGFALFDAIDWPGVGVCLKFERSL